MRGFEVHVEVSKGEDGFLVARCREFPGCATQGRTLAEVRRNFREALFVYLETLAETVHSGRTPNLRPTVHPRVESFRLVPVPA